MKTDRTLYHYLATGPEAFRVLTGHTLSGPYQYSSPTLKSTERRIDALFAPQCHNGPAYIVEFQAQWIAHAWYNLLTKIGLYGEEHPSQRIHGILIFPRRTLEPKPSRWIPNAASDLLSVVYLEDTLPVLLAQEPENPFVAVFGPLIIDDEATLRQQAPHLWQAIQQAPLPQAIRLRLEEVLECWLFERFKTLTAREIAAMLQLTTPLEETRAYQGILAEGIAKGKVEGKLEGKFEGKIEGKLEGKIEGKIEGEALLLKRLVVRRFGALPDWARTRIETADTAQIEAWGEAIFDAQDLERLLGQ